MDAATLLIELAEKMGLLAAAALVAVLFPPLRNRLLGVGRRADKLAAVALGLGLASWGAMLGFTVSGVDINIRAIGVLIAAILGGPKAGLITGLGAGLVYATRADAEVAPWSILGSLIDGGLAGWLVYRRPGWFKGWRVFASTISVQLVHLAVVGLGLLAFGLLRHHLPAWPAHLMKLLVNAAGVTLFVTVARLVVSREENRVALVEARAAANAAALSALRQRLEPHFLFNALNALRATIRTDPARAREMVADLADLYRYLLSHPEDAPLRAEADHAAAYLAIEQARHGDRRLRYTIEVDEEVREQSVPALLLQPLVENAVKHGVTRREGGGEVLLRAKREESMLVIEVEDRSDGEALLTAEEGSGIALSTLRERLSRRYGEAASLHLSTHEGGALARIELPFDEGLSRSRRAA